MLSFRFWICGSIVSGLLLMAAFPGAIQAQRRGNNPEFERNSPAVGERLPDITVFDANGDEFPLRSIKDHYSVVVFGCLT